MKNICVYQHKKLDNNEVFYVGIGVEKRAYNKIQRSDWWKKTVKKHGYIVEIIESNISWQQACDLEKKLISMYGRKDLKLGTLVNMTNGGDGTLGRKLSEKAKEKCRVTNLGRKRSQETIEKMRSAGKNISDETRKRMRLAKKNMSEAHRENLRNKQLGKKLSNETKEKISIANKSKSKEFHLKRTAALKKLILNTQTGIFYEGAKEAAESCNMKHTILLTRLNGTTKNNTSFIRV